MEIGKGYHYIYNYYISVIISAAGNDHAIASACRNDPPAFNYLIDKALALI